MTNNNIKILDCTLRDGGYYNNWDFERSLVNRYLLSLKNSSVDIVELGFRSLPKNNFSGPYLYTTDEFISHLDLDDNTIFGVMINGKELIDLDEQISIVNKLFTKKDNSKISLVRIAIDFKNALEVQEIAEELKILGYKIGLNLMQANGKKDTEYISIAEKINTWGAVDILYFADSLGNMSPNDVRNICLSLKQGWPGDLGIHTHNNKNLALINSITAIDHGVVYCDGTITGMGRGAGNVPTESLLLELSNMGLHSGNPNMIQPTVEDYLKIKNKFNWGSNLYYHYAANHRIHPTFVQSLLNDKRYDNQQVMGALGFLSERDSTSYSIEAVRDAIYGDNVDVEGTWDATNWLINREILIVGNGPSISRYRDDILNYIERYKPAVLLLNINRNLPSSIATATIVSHEMRALFDAQEYKKLNHPIILPKNRLGKLINNRLKHLEIFNYGLTLKEDSFKINPKGCYLEWPLAAAYALAVATQSNAKKISLVGFDGYDSDDLRQEEMNNVFHKYALLKTSIEINALTPTTYRIKQNSLYSL